jgi:NitT/TauT family transport system substrate-binding protein
MGDFRPFLALCHKHPGVILGRLPQTTPFSWKQLYGKRLLIPMAVTSQWMFLWGRLRALGVDLDRIQFIRDLHVDTTSALWRAGYADYYLVEPLYADAFIQEGYSLITTMAEAAGQVPWSVIYAEGRMFRESPGVIDAFKGAVAAANHWIGQADPLDVCRSLSDRFSNHTVDQITDVLARFRRTGVWNDTVEIDPSSRDAYQDIMIEYGLLDHQEIFLSHA